jgi:hypothetical protein
MGAGRRLSVASARSRAAGALGAAGRLLWRRSDLTDEDEVIVDLISEALMRIGMRLRPDAKLSAAAALRSAPEHIQDECALLVALACPLQLTPPGTSIHQGDLQARVSLPPVCQPQCVEAGPTSQACEQKQLQQVECPLVMSTCPIVDDAVLAVVCHGSIYAHSDVSMFDLSMLTLPSVAPPPPPPPTTSTTTFPNSLQDAQADTIALLCGRLDSLCLQEWGGADTEDWNVEAAVFVPAEVLPVICTCCTYHEGKNVGTILCESCLPGIDDIAAFFLGLPPEPLPPEAGGVPVDCQQQ